MPLHLLSFLSKSCIKRITYNNKKFFKSDYYLFVFFHYCRWFKPMLQLPRQQLVIVQWAAPIKNICIIMPPPVSQTESQVLGFRWEWFEHNWNSDWKWLGKFASPSAGGNWSTLFGSLQLINSLDHWWSSASTKVLKDIFVQRRK